MRPGHKGGSAVDLRRCIRLQAVDSRAYEVVAAIVARHSAADGLPPSRKASADHHRSSAKVVGPPSDCSYRARVISSARVRRNPAICQSSSADESRGLSVIC